MLTGRLARWMLLLHKFDFLIKHTPGKEHAVADYLSWLEIGEVPAKVIDQLPDANLFAAQHDLPESWYDQMLLFLTDGTLPVSFSID